MKKLSLIALLTALVMVLGMIPMTAMAEGDKIALVTDVGTIDDESFNQACWQAVEAYATANNIPYVYYQPTADSTDARLQSIDQAVAEGATVIVMPGYLFGATLVTCMEDYPEVKFIAVDVAAGDLTLDYVTYVEPSANTVCLTFSEEQAGYLAGYAAVKDGYTKLGFLGGMAVPAVIRYGYGFVQGADAAAKELNANIEINYTYGGQFQGSPEITAKMEGWYQAGTEIVFACGGGIYTSAVEAATKAGGMVIGVDVDQNYIGVKGVAEEQYTYNPFVTSAMKGLQNVTETVLGELFAGNWDTYSGQIKNYSLAEGEYVGLPTAESSWCFKTFTVEEYETVKNAIKEGTVVVNNNTEAEPEVSEFTAVNYIA
ncbi:MAG: BMP family ABC transporter substrate-binding protein [Clostridiales bacterium]|nr:BMP family ABC transporter substrate-binding protein [Clostridiales bacterium]